jgi:hypothetical protein
MHWVAWDIMLKPKIKGGMGFKDMRIFNQALLARQAWRLLQNPDSVFGYLEEREWEFVDGSL